MIEYLPSANFLISAVVIGHYRTLPNALQVSVNQLYLVWTKQNGAKAPSNGKGGTNMNNITEKILAHIRDKVKETAVYNNCCKNEKRPCIPVE